MSILDIFRRIFHPSSQGRGAFLRESSSASPYRYGLLPMIGQADPLTVATVYRCVKIISESVANLPVNYLRKRGDIFEVDDSDPLQYLLTVQPNPNMSAYDFWVQAVQHVLNEGNAYIIPKYTYDGMAIASLILCSRGSVSHDVTNNVYTVSDSLNGLYGTFREPEVIHLKNYTLDGKHGLSVLGFARQTIDIANVGNKETLSRFANGGNVRGLVSNGQDVRGFGQYQDEQLEKVAASMDGQFQSGSRIVALRGQVDFKQLSLSSTDMQFLESRKFTVREICRFFGVHPSFVFDDTSNNYKSAEMANVAFLSNTLNPLLRKIENELLRKLVSPKMAAKRRFAFDRSSLYSCDLASRVQYQTQTIAAGLYTVNEWRRVENKPAIEGGDRLLVSANLKDIQELTTQPQNEADDTQDNQEGGTMQ